MLPRPPAEAIEQRLDLARTVVYAATREHLDLGMAVGEKLDLPPLTRNDRQHHHGIVAVVLDREGDALSAKTVEEADELVQNGEVCQPNTTRWQQQHTGYADGWRDLER